MEKDWDLGERGFLGYYFVLNEF